MHFSPCRGGTNCTQDGTHCQGCGRSHEEIRETRTLVDAVAQFALNMGYENVPHFTQFVALKAADRARLLNEAKQSSVSV